MPALLIRRSIGRALGIEFLAERFDAGQRGQVERFDGQLRVWHGGADLLDRRLTLRAIADRHDDVGARSRQAGSDAEAEAGVGAGDDGQFSGLIGDRHFTLTDHELLLRGGGQPNSNGPSV